MSTTSSTYKLLVCAAGIYASFLTWALVQEPLNTRVWPVSDAKFQFPNVVAVAQASIAMVVGYVYLRASRVPYSAGGLVRDHFKELCLISFTMSTATPLATYSLAQVDYLTYMLAKSCKMIPVLLVHLLLYRTPIATQKKVVAVLVSAGVTLFSIGGSQGKGRGSTGSNSSYMGFALLAASLFMDGLTNASQDRMLKAARDTAPKDKQITGPHLMFALNLFIVLWNVLYLGLVDRAQLRDALALLALDKEVWGYLGAYAMCGAVGQCFIFYTLEQFGSLQLIMITVTRKMMSMLLSIAIFGKAVNAIQWTGILIVFSGITWEATNKRKGAVASQEKKRQ